MLSRDPGPPKGTNEIQLRGLQSVVHAHSAGASEVGGNFTDRPLHVPVPPWWSRAVSALLGLACQDNLTLPSGTSTFLSTQLAYAYVN